MLRGIRRFLGSLKLRFVSLAYEDYANSLQSEHLARLGCSEESHAWEYYES